MRSVTVSTTGGRRLDVLVAEGTGTPLVFHHGTPMSKVQFAPWAGVAAAAGLRLVTYSRPGYGSSERDAGRTVADSADDVEAILDALEADRCVTAGWSGGGPHALATGARLPSRTAAVATIAGVGEYGHDDLDFLAGMGELNVEEFGNAVARRDDALRSFMEGYVEDTDGQDVDALIEELASLLPPVDVAELTGTFGRFMVDSQAEAFRTGIWGWFDDDIAFTVPWGFDLAAMTVPVTIWQGAQDLMVPLAHGNWLATHVAGARHEDRPEHGHLSLAIAAFDQIVGDLAAAL
ncbi:MAG TPA: alpha/beta hydrolase [Actinomycetota bacterium]|nr:alpha/beta hydrolase [Actinomycetota bacterium]